MKALLLAFIMPVFMLAQGYVPTCNYDYALAGSQVTSKKNNVFSGCSDWILTYSGNAPVNVETSQDGVTWGTTGVVVKSGGGTLPTVAGFGRVIWSGYAPYLRLKSSGTSGQKVTGNLMGGPGLLASGVAPVPPYVFQASGGDAWASANPGIVSTNIGSNTTFTAVKGMLSVVSKDYGLAAFQFVCRAYPTPPFTARWTIQTPVQYWTNDAAHSVFLFSREVATEKWTYMRYRDKQFWNIGKCSKTVVNCDTDGGGIDGEFNIGASETWPITFEWKDSGTTTEYNLYDAVAGRSVLTKNSPITSNSTAYEVRQQLCIGSLASNGNYPHQFNLVGYEVIQ